MFGELLFPLTSLSVAIISFEGSLTLRFFAISTACAGPILNLVTLGAAINIFVLTAAAGISCAHRSASPAIGTIASVTGPTVVAPMLRDPPIPASTGAALGKHHHRSDPSAMRAVIALEFAMKGSEARSAGCLENWCYIGRLDRHRRRTAAWRLLKRHLVPWYLRNVVTWPCCSARSQPATRLRMSRPAGGNDHGRDARE